MMRSQTQHSRYSGQASWEPAIDYHNDWPHTREATQGSSIEIGPCKLDPQGVKI